ncbi:MAG: polysaccharide ABC transporter ATP-binding protein [Gemmatimonadaceae bacterium]
MPALFRRALGRRPAPAHPGRDFWALRDVSFEVRPGEALGIIGQNGAGKSTVLKVVTRILDPTHGHAEVRGRVGALIELTAGFHQDLTGRENVFLQGSFMGMRRAEIARKFDEIVDFAGIGEFIDTPVKRYSSGMNARLGFSIAAHLDPDVLIVDEVLAVGDAAFQRKAFARVTELVRRDIPVIVVSHQLEQVAALCTAAIVLERGRVVQRGSPGECVAGYLQRALGAGGRPGEGAVEILSMDAWGGTTVGSGEWLTLSLQCAVRDPERTEGETVGVRLRAADGLVLFETDAARAGAALPRDSWYRFDVSLQLNVLPGGYLVESFVWNEPEARQMEAGPALGVNVVPGRPFTGWVQMNARAWVTHAPEHGDAAGWAAPGDALASHSDRPSARQC